MTPAPAAIPSAARAALAPHVFRNFNQDDFWRDEAIIFKSGRAAVFPGVQSSDQRVRKTAEQDYRRHMKIFNAMMLAAGDRDVLKKRLDEELGGVAERVEKEKIISSYLKKVNVLFPWLGLSKKAGAMDVCHQSCTIGLMSAAPSYDWSAAIDAGARAVFIWDHKCEDVRLCPHSAWKESKRLIESYRNGIWESMIMDLGNRIFHTVLTVPNVPEGKLRAGKRNLFDQTKAWLRHGAAACPLIMNERTGRWQKTKPFSLAECVTGSLVTQEDPLGASYTWHVHNNLIMLTRGQFDYSLAREWWSEIVFGNNRDPRDEKKRAVLHFSPVDPVKLDDALIEIIKYPILTVGEKSLDSDVAPPMTAWPPSLFVEWFNANQNFRRTRSYGCLYAIDRKRWDLHDAQGRYDKFFQPARDRGYVELDLDYVELQWTEIPPAHRAQLRRVMRCPNPFDLSGVRWLGQAVYLGRNDGYYVDLNSPAQPGLCVPSIPGDNFSQNGHKTDNFQTGPPGPGRR